MLAESSRRPSRSSNDATATVLRCIFNPPITFVALLRLDIASNSRCDKSSGDRHGLSDMGIARCTALCTIPRPMQSKREFVVEPIGLDVEKLSRPIDWAALFGNDHPVEIEIGMGKGTFLTDQAIARPETNFFGIEWARWFWRYASDRLRRHDCRNARTARVEALFFLAE